MREYVKKKYSWNFQSARSSTIERSSLSIKIFYYSSFCSPGSRTSFWAWRRKIKSFETLCVNFSILFWKKKILWYVCEHSESYNMHTFISRCFFLLTNTLGTIMKYFVFAPHNFKIIKQVHFIPFHWRIRLKIWLMKFQF